MWCQIVGVVAQRGNRRCGAAFTQFLFGRRHAALLRDQHRQPGTDKTAAGDGREIVELSEQARARKCLHHTKRKGGAANAAARQAQCGLADR